MASIEDIWDDPVEGSIGPRTTPAASKSKDPLFLADSDDDERPRKQAGAASDMDVDIDAMFAGVEDDAFSFEPLKDIDTEALRKQEEARHRKNMPPLTPHQIMSSSPPPEGDDAGGAGTGKKDDGKKERKKPARLDEGRLLGPDGFPALIKEVKRFKPKGKGQEAADLDRLLRIYGYWTHALFPKTTFKDTVDKVEKLCHSKRMHVALSVWRDEWHGRTGEQKTVGEDDSDDDLFGDKETAHGNAEQEAQPQEIPAPSSDGASEPPSSAPPSRPQSITGDDFDDFDIDEILRAEEKRAAEEDAQSRGNKKFRNLVVDSDEEIPEEFLSSPTQTNSNPKPAMDDDMWDILDEMDGPGQPQPPPPVPTSKPTEKNTPEKTNDTAAMEVDEYDIEDMYA